MIGGDGPNKGFSAPMVKVINYDFKSITYKTVKPEEPFINFYVDELLESDSTMSSTRRIRMILDVNDKKSDLNKVMAKQCQHLTTTERYRLLNLLKKFKDMSGGTLGTWNSTAVDLELKDDVKPVFS